MLESDGNWGFVNYTLQASDPSYTVVSFFTNHKQNKNMIFFSCYYNGVNQTSELQYVALTTHARNTMADVTKSQ